MEFTDDKKFIEAIYKKSSANYQPVGEEQAQFSEIYKKAFKLDVPKCNCPNRYTDALYKLMRYYKTHQDYTACSYTIRAGVVFVYKYGTDLVAISNENATDEIVEAILKENENAPKFITKNPDAVVAVKPTTTTTTTKKIKKSNGSKN